MVVPVLPKNLANFKISGRNIIPVFLIEKDKEIVQKCLDIWLSSQGKTMREIKERFSELEEFENYKVIRGLLYVLSRISEFEKSFEEAHKAREFIFALGPALTHKEKEKIKEKFLEKFGFDITPEKLWGDLENYRVLKNIPEIHTDELMRIYNLALASAIVLLSHMVKFRVSENIGDVLRLSKKLGLMYDVVSEGRKRWIAVFGPASIIKESQRYGVALSRIFRKVIEKSEFEISVELKNKMCMRLSEKDKIFFPQKTEDIKFDSRYEEEIYRLLKDVFPTCKILREPEAIELKNGIFLPDFKIESGTKEVFVEVVGYWTEEYIRKKSEKLSEFRDKILIVASEEFALSPLSNIESSELIVFRRNLPLLDVIKKLRKMGISEPVVGKKSEGKTELTDKNEKETGTFTKVAPLIHDGMDYSDFLKVLESFSIKDKAKLVLQKLGYYVEWETLLPPKGKLRKKGK